MNAMKLTIACVLFGLLGISSGCANNGDSTMQNAPIKPDATPFSWDSPRLLRVQRKWDRLRASYGKTTWTKDNFGERARSLDNILRRDLSEADLRQLARSCETLPLRKEDRSPFVNSVFDYMVVALIHSSDRESLVTLLSTRCPDRIYMWTDIELDLAYSATEKKLQYPILILGDAYSRCKVPEVRHDIANVVRRGFSTMHVPSIAGAKQNDDEYVKNAMEWYRLHKDELVPNNDYSRNSGEGPPYTYPLFTWKAAAEKHK